MCKNKNFDVQNVHIFNDVMCALKIFDVHMCTLCTWILHTDTTGLVVTPNQCRTKWNSLKRGYENLIRIMNDNRRGYPLSNPNSFDEACFGEMSDEFWVVTSNYF